MRASDFVGRYGGEEFVAILPETDRPGAAEVAEKLRRAVSKITVPYLEQTVSASFGVAAYPADAIDPEMLLRIADRALYVAKENGRNRVEVAASEVPGWRRRVIVCFVRLAPLPVAHDQVHQQAVAPTAVGAALV